MTPVTSKVCVVGDFAVGKTSFADRFVNNHFSDKYLTTVGVKIDTKEIEFPDYGIQLKLVIWDVAGSNRFGAAEMAYLRGASGLIFVADGTRSSTLTAAHVLRDQIAEAYGPAPGVLLVNKSDLGSQWEVSEKAIEDLASQYDAVFRTSAKSGEGVEAAMTDLARRIIDAELS